MSIAYKLKKDPNKNVYSNFDGIDEIKETYFEDEIGTNTNYLFVDKMMILKDEFGITKNLPLNSIIRLIEIDNQIKQPDSLKTTTTLISEEYNNLSETADISMKIEEVSKQSEVEVNSEMDVDSPKHSHIEAEVQDDINISERNQDNILNKEEK